MEQLAGSSSVEVEPLDGSTCGEAMRQPGRGPGDRFPAEVRDAKQGAFTPLVSVFVNYTEVEDLGQPLYNGGGVLMSMPVAGR